jgi:hypothetical protein
MSGEERGYEGEVETSSAGLLLERLEAVTLTGRVQRKLCRALEYEP